MSTTAWATSPSTTTPRPRPTAARSSITAQGRNITGAVWRPATILAGVPQPLTGTPATAAVQSWNAARSCTNLATGPSTSLTTMRGETVPFVAPVRTTGHHHDDDAQPPASGTTRHAPRRADRSGSTGSGTTATTTTTTQPAPTTTAPTDNAG